MAYGQISSDFYVGFPEIQLKCFFDAVNDFSPWQARNKPKAKEPLGKELVLWFPHKVDLFSPPTDFLWSLRPKGADGGGGQGREATGEREREWGAGEDLLRRPMGLFAPSECTRADRETALGTV